MRHIACTALVIFLAGCEGPDPLPTGGGWVDEAIEGETCAPAPTHNEEVNLCASRPTDYQPRINGSAADAWPPCISDGGSYCRIQESVSTISRVEAFESIGALLWENGARPMSQDFIEARIRFEEDQGLGSRVARRYDIHYDPPPGGQSCSDAGVADQYPDYCVGPATLQPLIVEAFAAGAQGRDRVVNAARIKAALEWFFYLSILKEAKTCSTTPKDCDSAWAYYCGGTERDHPLGLARLIDALSPETHDRAYDGVLAVRCWKNLDHEDGESTDLELRDRAIGQLDRAVQRGMALLVRQRFAALDCSAGDYRRAAHEGLSILVPLLDHATRQREESSADLLLDQIRRRPGEADASAAMRVLDRLYECP